MTTSSKPFPARLLLSILAVSTLAIPSQAAVSYISLEDRNLGFHAAVSEPLRIPLDFIPLSGSSHLWLDPYSYVSGTSWLISQGMVRIVNSGGLIRAMDAGSLIGPDLEPPAIWYAGEPNYFENPHPFPNNGFDRYHVLMEGWFLPPPSEFYKDEAYIGLEFEIDGLTHYGWLSTEREPGDHPWATRPASHRITGFAYETEPGVPITAGAIPEPSVLLLVLSASAAMLVRRQRAASGQSSTISTK